MPGIGWVLLDLLPTAIQKGIGIHDTVQAKVTARRAESAALAAHVDELIADEQTAEDRAKIK